MIFYPLVATLISAAFAVTLWRQYRAKPRPSLQVGLLDTHQVPSADVIKLQHGIFNVAAILMAAILNIVGSVILIGGAVWSFFSMWLRGAPPSRLVGNILIAGGAFIVAGASTLFRLFHVYDLFYVGQAIGVLVMFFGFLAAQRAPRRAANLNPVASR